MAEKPVGDTDRRYLQYHTLVSHASSYLTISSHTCSTVTVRSSIKFKRFAGDCHRRMCPNSPESFRARKRPAPLS
eukprot:6783317-Prymnesium_polylepis.1